MTLHHCALETPIGAAGTIGRAMPWAFGPDDRRLFGWLHLPEGPARAGAVLLCEPIGYDAILSHRAYRRLAELGADAGLAVLRFSYAGTGDSAGTEDDGCRWEEWLRSTAAAREELRRVVPDGPMSLVGLRMGGTIALQSATAAPVDQLVLWQPIANGRTYVRELRALAALTGEQGLPADAELEAGGFRFPEALVQSLSGITPAGLAAAPSPRVLVLQRDDLPASPVLPDRLRELGAHVVERCVSGYDEMMRDPHESVVPMEALETIVASLLPVHPPTDVRLDQASLSTATSGEVACSSPDGATALVERPRVHGAAARLIAIETRRAAHDDAARTIVLLNAGALHRIGPNRLFVTLAREWAALGYRVLRLDLSGLGDSEAHAAQITGDPYSSEHLDDVRTLVTQLREEMPTMQLTLAGLCSGAYLAFTAAATGVAVDRIVAINPLTFYWHEGDTLQNPPVAHFADVSYYRSALTSGDRWKRLLTGRSDNRAALRTIGNEISRRLEGVRRLFVPRPAGDDDLAGDLRTIAQRGIRTIFVFSENDPGRRLLEAGAGSELRRLMRAGHVRLLLVPDADHTFSSAVHRVALRRLLRDALSVPANEPIGPDPVR